jgi:hypothetical protein
VTGLPGEPAARVCERAGLLPVTSLWRQVTTKTQAEEARDDALCGEHTRAQSISQVPELTIPHELDCLACTAEQ